MNAFGIDLSRYNPQFPIPAGAIDFLCTRIGGSTGAAIFTDPGWITHCQQAQDIDIPCIGYWFVNPAYYIGKQLTMPGILAMSNDKHPIMPTLLNEIANRNVSGLAFDVEEGTFTGQVTPAWVAFYIKDICVRLNKLMDTGALRRIRLGVYSRKTWMDDPNNQGKDLGIWLGTQPEMFIWSAAWIGGEDKTLPIEQARTLMPVSGTVPAFGWTESRVPADWTIWQFSGDAPGCTGYKNNITNSHVDLDMFHGDVTNMRQYFNLSPVTPPVVVPPVVIPPVVPPAVVTLETVSAQIAALTAKFDKHFKE
jgi:hypothetical protein